MSKNRNRRKAGRRRGRVTPKQRGDALRLVDGVTLNGHPFGVVVFECDDPACLEHRR